jgi:predicted GIY-YIG superfamily endonuclease
MKWTKENCIKEILNYKTKKDFYEKSRNAYQASYKKGWLDEISNNLIGNKRNFFTKKENCIEEALKYISLSDFSKKSPGAYKSSHKNGWLNEISSHMHYIGHKYKRCIYCYIFDDNSIYVGLTYNLEKRNLQHLSNSKSKVFIHIKKSDIEPILVQLTDYINIEDARKLEYYFLIKYTNEGFKILNKNKVGGIGGCSIKWTEEKCLYESLKYNSYKDFKKENKGAYIKAQKEGWIKFYKHLKKNNIWTKENCHFEAIKYKTRNEFQLYSGSAYISALRNKWLDDICKHMSNYRLPKGYWTLDKCHSEALKYNSRKSYSENSSSSYQISSKNKWLNIICKHMNGR